MIKDLRVLLVDDDATILEILATYFESNGYFVESYTDAPQALNALAERPFDLVISDIDMAGMDGYEFLRRARGRYPGLAIILMTAYDERYPLSEALSAGADGYITKPFSLKKMSLIFERAYWTAIARDDWWKAHDDGLELALPD